MTAPAFALIPNRPRWDDHHVRLIENAALGPHRRLRLEAPGLAGRLLPGQFVNLSVPGHLLRRPLAVAWQDEKTIELIVTPFGPGTRKLASLPAGTRLMALGPLGNGFPEPAGDLAIVSAGAGVAALLLLARNALEQGRRVHVFHGAASSEDAELMAATYQRIGLKASYFSEDGALGRRGLPTDGLRELLESGAAVTIYSVGPYSMMRGAALLALEYGQPGYVSLDVHMACGVGSCRSCAVLTEEGQKYACVDGPVFAAGEVVW